MRHNDFLPYITGQNGTSRHKTDTVNVFRRTFATAIVPQNPNKLIIMLKYKKYQNKNDDSTAYGKWYGRLVHELMEFDEFIEHMANHHCVFSEATIRGVLIEMEVCLRELLLEGKAVRLDDLGIFSLGMSTKGKVEKKDFNADCIKSLTVNLFLGKRFRAKDLLADAKFKEADKYIGDGNYYEPDDDDEVAGGGDTSGSGDEPIPGGNETIPSSGGQG